MKTETTVHVNEYLKSLCDLQKYLTERLKELSPVQSQLNKKQEELLHLLELENLTEEQYLKAAKKLKEIRIERRKIKQEVQDINQALRGFKFDISSQPQYEILLSYEYSEDITNSIF